MVFRYITSPRTSKSAEREEGRTNSRPANDADIEKRRGAKNRQQAVAKKNLFRKRAAHASVDDAFTLSVWRVAIRAGNVFKEIDANFPSYFLSHITLVSHKHLSGIKVTDKESYRAGVHGWGRLYGSSGRKERAVFNVISFLRSEKSRSFRRVVVRRPVTSSRKLHG